MRTFIRGSTNTGRLKAWASMIQYFDIGLLVYVGNTFEGTLIENQNTVGRYSTVENFANKNE